MYTTRPVTGGPLGFGLKQTLLSLARALLPLSSFTQSLLTEFSSKGEPATRPLLCFVKRMCVSAIWAWERRPARGMRIYLDLAPKQMYYTDNGFDSMTLLLANTSDCVWAFNAVGQQVPSSRLYCLERDPSEPQARQRLVSSDSYFANSGLDKRVLDLGGGSVIGLTLMEAFVVVAVVRFFVVPAER